MNERDAHLAKIGQMIEQEFPGSEILTLKEALERGWVFRDYRFYAEGYAIAYEWENSHGQRFRGVRFGVEPSEYWSGVFGEENESG